MARLMVMVGAGLVILVVSQLYLLYELPLWMDTVAKGLGVLVIAAVWTAAVPPFQDSEVSKLKADVESLRAEVLALRSQQKQ